MSGSAPTCVVCRRDYRANPDVLLPALGTPLARNARFAAVLRDQQHMQRGASARRCRNNPDKAAAYEDLVTISPALRKLLHRISTGIDAALEVYGADWKRLYPDASGGLDETAPLTALLRDAAASGLNHVAAHGVRAAVRALRDESGQAIAYVVVKTEEHDAAGSERRLKELGELVHAAIEVELASSATVEIEQRQSMRFLAALRFVSGLSGVNSEQELLQPLVQAAALWFDVEATAYRREFSGEYVRLAALPHVERGRYPKTLKLRDERSSQPRILSTTELEEIDWPTSTGDVVLVPLGPAEHPSWVLLLAGGARGDAQRLFAALAAILASALEQPAIKKARELTLRLSECLASGSPPAAASMVVQEISRVFSAPRVELLLRRGERAETIARVGEPAELSDAADWTASVVLGDRLEFPLPRSGDAFARLIVLARPEAPFSPTILPVADAALRVLEVWLSARELTESLVLTVEAAPFEKRLEEELERARTSRREFALLLVDVSAISAPSEQEQIRNLLDVLRPELRGSDLVGSLERGVIAALLGHVTADSAASVEKRVRLRLSETARKKRLPVVLLGQAAFPSGGESLAALVARARAQAAPVAGAS
jgi:GGDEF domain-containing protein